MVLVKKVILDVLKPHIPKGLELARAITELGESYHVTLTVAEVDEKTETVVIVIEGEDIQIEAIENTLNSMGASLHSIDEVEVVNVPDTE